MLTLAQIAAIFQVSPRTFSRMVSEKRLPFYAVGRSRRFDLDEVKRALVRYERENAVSVAGKGKAGALPIKTRYDSWLEE